MDVEGVIGASILHTPFIRQEHHYVSGKAGPTTPELAPGPIFKPVLPPNVSIFIFEHSLPFEPALPLQPVWRKHGLCNPSEETPPALTVAPTSQAMPGVR